MSLILRYMTLPDIPQVIAIDRLAFDLPWSERSYAYEVSESPHSYMVVLENTVERPSTGWRRWLGSRDSIVKHERRVVGYGGLWNLMGEAHISTIAVHPDWRGRGYGEILLAGMVRRGISLNADFVVLEVRVSNHIAQNLYHKYDFQTMIVKPRYYRNNNEDAYEMRLDIQSGENRGIFERRYTALKERMVFVDRYTISDPPNRRSDSLY